MAMRQLQIIITHHRRYCHEIANKVIKLVFSEVLKQNQWYRNGHQDKNDVRATLLIKAGIEKWVIMSARSSGEVCCATFCQF